MAQPDPRGHPRLDGYAFGEVRVDLLRRSVAVGGVEAACRPLVFQLLVLLCEAGGAVVERAEIFARLWPEAAAPSDESLTQIAHRLRTTLGTSGDALRTVRGVGFRLDAAVEPLVHAAPEAVSETVFEKAPVPQAAETPATAVPPPIAVPPSIAAPIPAPSSRRAAGFALLLLFLAASLAGLWQLWRSREILDAGFALRRADLSASRDETADLVHRALVTWGEGDRLRARTLLETAHRTDGATPIPAVLLALLSFDTDGSWAAEAARRLPPGASAYQRLLVRYAGLSKRRENAESVATLSALLELRPAAWELRLARAHYHLARRETAAALADLRRIPVPSLDNRGLALALADRASLGDAAGAERELAAARREGPDSLADFVHGRILRSKGHPALARQALQRAIDEATRRNQPDLATESRFLAGIAAFESGDAAAAALALDEFANEPANPHREETAEALALGAWLAARRGDPGGRDERLAEAHRRLEGLVKVTGEGTETRIAMALLELRLGRAPDGALRAFADRIIPQPELLGVRSLLLARLVFAQVGEEGGNGRAEAARLLQQSRQEGVGQTYFAEEAALLGAELGEPPPRLRVDPPYPNLLRFTAVWELDRRRAAGGR